jgi:transposase
MKISYQILKYNSSMNRLKITTDESLETIEKHYRQAKDGVERTQWQVIWLLAKGETSERVAAVTGYTLNWVRKLARRYNAEGAEALGDHRHANPGKKVRLSSRHQSELKKELEEAYAQGQAWTGVKVAAWMSEKMGESVYPQRGWEMLRRLGFRSKVPRPRHNEADVAEQEAVKKRSRLRLKPGQ